MNEQRILDQTDIEILKFLADGMTLGAIGRRLDLSERTVRRRLRGICDDIGVGSPIAAVVWAVRRGVL